jgi:hypothetical protein
LFRKKQTQVKLAKVRLGKGRSCANLVESNLGHFHGGHPPKTWLTGVSLNFCVSLLQLPKSYNEPDRAERTLSRVLALGESSVQGAGLGVWTRVPLAEGHVFGPFEGVRTRVQDFADPSAYSWTVSYTVSCQAIAAPSALSVCRSATLALFSVPGLAQIKRADKVVAELDAADSSRSNWMRYVNCAASKAQLNIKPFQVSRPPSPRRQSPLAFPVFYNASSQFQGQLYYRTVCEVPAHTELMVYYGDTYARLLGIDTRRFHRGSV